MSRFPYLLTIMYTYDILGSVGAPSFRTHNSISIYNRKTTMDILNAVDTVLVGLPKVDRLINKVAEKLLGSEIASACTDHWTEEQCCGSAKKWCYTGVTMYEFPYDLKQFRQCCSSWGGPKQCGAWSACNTPACGDPCLDYPCSC